MKNWLRFASRTVAIVSMDSRASVTLAAMTSRVSRATILAGLARCIAFAIVTAMRRPVKLPGPMEM